MTTGGTHATHDREPKPVPPCVKCGTKGGYTRPHEDRPVRMDARKVGLEGGKLCTTCYSQLYRAQNLHRLGTRGAADPHIEPEELDARTARVRAAKKAKGLPEDHPFLTGDELDEALGEQRPACEKDED